MSYQLPSELQNVVDRISGTAERERKDREAQEAIVKSIRNISGDSNAVWGPQERKANPNIGFRPLVRQGNNDTLLITIPESAFIAYNYSSFRDAADRAIAHVQHHRAVYCPGGAAYQQGFDLQKRPLSMWGLDEAGRPVAYFNVAIADQWELQQAHWMIDAQRSQYTLYPMWRWG